MPDSEVIEFVMLLEIPMIAAVLQQPYIGMKRYKLPGNELAMKKHHLTAHICSTKQRITSTRSHLRLSKSWRHEEMLKKMIVFQD